MTERPVTKPPPPPQYRRPAPEPSQYRRPASEPTPFRRPATEPPRYRPEGPGPRQAGPPQPRFSPAPAGKGGYLSPEEYQKLTPEQKKALRETHLAAEEEPKR